MSVPRVNAVGVVSSNLPRTIAFYRALGCHVPEPDANGHLEIDLDGFALMIDTEDTMRSFDPDWHGVGSGRVTLAVECDSPAEVDRLHGELSLLGGGSHLVPFDAFWGQHYATVLDPDGVRVDLYASLPATA